MIYFFRSNRKGSASSSAVKRKNSRAASSSDSRRGSVNNVNGLDSRSDDSGSINTIDQVGGNWKSARGLLYHCPVFRSKSIGTYRMSIC